MKKLFLLTFSIAVFQCNAQITSVELVEHYTIADIYNIVDGLGIPDNFVPVNYEVDFYRIGYTTPHPDGSDVVVSGALCIPSGTSCPFPLSSYQHGTIALRSDAPSYQSTEGLLCALHASSGFVVAAADYIGLGSSPLLHLYVHAESEANACVDLMRAARELQIDLGFNLSDEIIIWGYSQGGHATAALQRKIETELTDEFSLTASAPMSGPYSISGVQAEVLTADEPYPTPGYLPYVVLSYQEAYGNIFNDINEVFIEPYASALPDLFDGNHSMGEINNFCPDIPNQMLQPAFIATYNNDPDHPMRIALEDNDVMDWAPQIPTTLIYCTGDDQVNYMNAIVAESAFYNLGSTSVGTADMGNFDHGVCAPFAMYEGLNFFNQFIEAPFNPIVQSTITNPSEENGGNDGSIEVSVDAMGDWTFEWSNNNESLSLEDLSPGEYILTIISEVGCIVNYEFELELSTSISHLIDSEIRVFPIPAEQLLNIELSKNLSFQIFNFDGRAMFSSQGKTSNKIDISDWSSGIYFLRAESGEVRKILIN